jgi:hypothetical protein
MDCRCSFKAFGVTLLHFKVDKINWGVIFTKFFFSQMGEHPLWKTPEIAGKTWISGYSRKILILGFQFLRMCSNSNTTMYSYNYCFTLCKPGIKIEVLPVNEEKYNQFTKINRSMWNLQWFIPQTFKAAKITWFYSICEIVLIFSAER